MLKFLRRLFGKSRPERNANNHGPANHGDDRNPAMENQKLTAITQGLQHAAAETNSMVAEQYIRILAQYFDKDESGTLHARMVRVQITDDHYANVPLVALATPAGLALDRMRVQLSIRLENAQSEDPKALDNIRAFLRKGHEDSAKSGEESGTARSDFSVSLSPRDRDSKRRPSDHVDIDLEFKSIETPEAVMRVIDTYTNLLQPIPGKADRTPDMPPAGEQPS